MCDPDFPISERDQFLLQAKMALSRPHTAHTAILIYHLMHDTSIWLHDFNKVPIVLQAQKSLSTQKILKMNQRSLPIS